MNRTREKNVQRLLRLVIRLAADEVGTISWIGMIVGTSVFSLGAIVGLVTLRDQLVQQYGDTAVAIDHLDQSWSYDIGIDRNGDGDFADTGECTFQAQYVDSSALTDSGGVAPAGIVFAP